MNNYLKNVQLEKISFKSNRHLSRWISRTLVTKKAFNHAETIPNSIQTNSDSEYHFVCISIFILHQRCLPTLFYCSDGRNLHQHRVGPLKSTAELGFLDPSRNSPSNQFTAIESELLCTICQNILWKPVACFTCQNTFCANCIQTWISKQISCPTVTCPFHCRFQEKRAPPILNSFLSRLQISCAYAPNGCREIIPYDALEKHEETCQYERIPCEICQTPVSNRDRDNKHDLKQCFHRMYERGPDLVQAQFMKLLEVVEASQQRIQALENLLGVQPPRNH